jgi:hypothetical protein
MRTEALLVALLPALALAQAPEAEPGATAPGNDDLAARFEVGVPAEVTLVGLTAGLRPEVLFRFGAPGTASRLRFAVGVLAGPEQLFVPLSLGYRAVYRQGELVQPVFGVGLELQHRFAFDLPVVRAFGLYLEGGVGFEVAPGWSVGALLAVDVMVVGMPGFGFGPRAFFTARL